MSKTSKLRLDFSIESAEDRKKFLDEYLIINGHKLTSDELEMCGNYILWGKNSEGKNTVQEKLVKIKTRFGTWDNLQEAESLDALMAEPAFNENQIKRPSTPQTKIPQTSFSRERARQTAPPHLQPIFEELFAQIDNLDLLINYYDLDHGKRKKPIRDSLLDKFSDEEKSKIHEDSTHLNQYQYLKKRHELAYLREEQYKLKDSYMPIIQMRAIQYLDDIDRSTNIGVEIPVLPLGLFGKDHLSSLLFQNPLNPHTFSEKDLIQISNFYWEKDSQKIDRSLPFIDFRCEDHLLGLFEMFFELEDESREQSIEGTVGDLLRTFEFYIGVSDLTECQREILQMKMRKVKNQNIANYINQKYDKTYSANYISTIFRQKIIKQIAEAAQYHKEIVSNLFFPENFKTCTKCGRLLLIDSNNFIRKTRSKDGFSNRCKECDRKERQNKKR